MIVVFLYGFCILCHAQKYFLYSKIIKHLMCFSGNVMVSFLHIYLNFWSNFGKCFREGLWWEPKLLFRIGFPDSRFPQKPLLPLSTVCPYRMLGSECERVCFQPLHCPPHLDATVFTECTKTPCPLVEVRRKLSCQNAQLRTPTYFVWCSFCMTLSDRKHSESITACPPPQPLDSHSARGYLGWNRVLVAPAHCV